jgi:hypothetical protein
VASESLVAVDLARIIHSSCEWPDWGMLQIPLLPAAIDETIRVVIHIVNNRTLPVETFQPGVQSIRLLRCQRKFVIPPSQKPEH